MPVALLALLLSAAPAKPDAALRARCAWLDAQQPVRTLEASFAPPPGFERVAEAEGSFAAFLRGLPLLPEGAPVLGFDGQVVRAPDDPHVAAVAALDVGRRDLQQCADAIIRLHAEWRWPALGGEDLSYRLTNGQAVHWSDWRAGKRGLKQVASAVADGSHASFRGWLDFVFTYAGTRSLWAYAQKIPRAALQPGDFFVSPATSSLGHAVLVLDLARDAQGHSVALLGQGFTPAQSFHVLQRAPGQAWFPLDGEKIETPFWTPFGWADLRRLP